MVFEIIYAAHRPDRPKPAPAVPGAARGRFPAPASPHAGAHRSLTPVPAFPPRRGGVPAAPAVPAPAPRHGGEVPGVPVPGLAPRHGREVPGVPVPGLAPRYGGEVPGVPVPGLAPRYGREVPGVPVPGLAPRYGGGFPAAPDVPGLAPRPGGGIPAAPPAPAFPGGAVRALTQKELFGDFSPPPTDVYKIEPKWIQQHIKNVQEDGKVLKGAHRASASQSKNWLLVVSKILHDAKRHGSKGVQKQVDSLYEAASKIHHFAFDRFWRENERWYTANHLEHYAEPGRAAGGSGREEPQHRRGRGEAGHRRQYNAMDERQKAIRVRQYHEVIKLPQLPGEITEAFGSNNFFKFDKEDRKLLEEAVETKFSGKPRFRPKITVSAEDTLQAALTIMANDKRAKVAVVNFANENHPGGGVEHGASAQEEELCRRLQGYWLSLKEYERSLKRLGLDYDIPTYGVLFTPGAKIAFDQSYRPMDGPEVAVIAAAAPRYDIDRHGSRIPSHGKFDPSHAAKKPGKEAIPKYYEEEHIRDDMMQAKTDMILLVAALKGYTTVVGGALGCGAFHHEAKDVVRYWQASIRKYGQYFEHIHMAVLPLGGTHNLEVFADEITPFATTFVPGMVVPSLESGSDSEAYDPHDNIPQDRYVPDPYDGYHLADRDRAEERFPGHYDGSGAPGRGEARGRGFFPED